MTRPLTDAQARILHTICRLDRSAEAPYTATELAHATRLRPSTVQSALRSLERSGEVVRVGTALTGGSTWGLNKDDAA